MMRVVTLACAAISTVLGAAYAYAGNARPTGILHDLQRAQPERVYAARFSAEGAYHACAADPAFADSVVQRETCGTLRPAPAGLEPQLAAAAGSLDSDSLRLAGLASILWWNRSAASLDSAIGQLALSRTLARDPVAALVDLSAAYLIRAELRQSVQDVLWGLNHALEALELEPGNVRARYNVALAAQAVPLKATALELWDAYLAVDSTSPYADEARRRRGLLLAPDTLAWPTAASGRDSVNAYAAFDPQRARELGWEVVLGRWGKAVLADNPAAADSQLVLAEQLGTALKYHGGDASLADAVYAIHAARGNRAATTTLARAHHAFAAAAELFRLGQHAASGDSFAQVVRLRPGSPTLRGWARVSSGAALILARRTEEARRVLSSQMAETDTIRHLALAARTHWTMGQLLRGDSSSVSRRHLRRAAEMYARLRERENYGAMRYREAWAAHADGDAATGYRATNEALNALNPYRGSPHLHGTLTQLASLAGKDGMNRAAELIQDEINQVAHHFSSPITRLEALLSHARILALADSDAQALRVLASAAPRITELPDSQQAEFAKGVMLYSRALVDSTEAGVSAALDSAKLHLRNTAWPPTILTRRVDVRLAAGDLHGAEEDLDSLAMYGRELAGYPAVPFLAAVMERLRSRYDRLVMGYLRAGQPIKALEALERGRLSFAPDTSRHRFRWPRLGAQEVALNYTLIGDTLLISVLSRDSLTVREQRLDRGELMRAVARVGAALESGHDDGADDDLRHLYDVLIRPVRDHVPGRETELVIVADGEIAGVPFHALMERGRRLVQDHPIRFAASLMDAPAATDSTPADGHVLLVANPAFDQGANPELRSLPGALAEVDSLGRMYGGAAVLADSGATVEAFRAQVRGARVIHYAGHAVFDASRPEQSFLLLAGEGTSGRLRADSLHSLPLAGVRLMVLSACRTLRGSQGRSGGFDGLSGALLSTGVGGVVGSLWLVDDSLAQPLMREFHRAYRRGEHPARALRIAQLRMIQAGHPPSAWAGFRYAGR